MHLKNTIDIHRNFNIFNQTPFHADRIGIATLIWTSLIDTTYQNRHSVGKL